MTTSVCLVMDQLTLPYSRSQASFPPPILPNLTACRLALLLKIKSAISSSVPTHARKPRDQKADETGPLFGPGSGR